MAKYSIAWMPGDGIGNDVMDAAKHRPRRHEARRRVRPVRYRLGILVQGRQRAPRPHRRRVAEDDVCPVRRDHQQAAGRRASRNVAGTQGQEALVLLARSSSSGRCSICTRTCGRAKAIPAIRSTIAARCNGNPTGGEVMIDQVVFRENTEGIVRRRRVSSAAAKQSTPPCAPIRR